MSRAIIKPNQFTSLFQKFQTTYTNEGPVLPMYFVENNTVYFYMVFRDVVWETSVKREDMQLILTPIGEAIALSARYD